jgi:hypothetical protein
VLEKKKTMTMCHVLLWCYCSEESNGSFNGFAMKKVMAVMPSPSFMVMVLPLPYFFYSFSSFLVLLV